MGSVGMCVWLPRAVTLWEPPRGLPVQSPSAACVARATSDMCTPSPGPWVPGKRLLLEEGGVDWTDQSREPVLDSGSWQACFPSRRRPSTASSMAPQKLRGPWQTQFFLIPTTEQPPLPRMRPRRRLAELRAGSFGHLQALL